MKINDDETEVLPLIRTPQLKSKLHLTSLLSLQNISIFGSKTSIFGSTLSILGLKRTVNNTVYKHLNLSEVKKSHSLHSLVSIPPFASQNYI